MRTQSPNRRVVVAAGTAVVLAVVLAFATAARGTGAAENVEIAKLKKQVAALKAEVAVHPAIRSQLNVISVSARIQYIDAAGFHGLETKYASGTFTARDVTLLKNVLAVTAKIPWPESLRGDAADLRTSLRSFVSAWDAGNKDAGMEALKAAHSAQHALSAGAYLWLS